MNTNYDCSAVQRAIAEMPRAGALPQHAAAHLAACPECAVYLQQMQSLGEALSELHAAAPADLYPRVVAAMPEKAGIGTWRLAFLVGLLMVAIAAALVSWYWTVGPGATGFGDESRAASHFINYEESSTGATQAAATGSGAASASCSDCGLNKATCRQTSQPAQAQSTPLQSVPCRN